MSLLQSFLRPSTNTVLAELVAKLCGRTANNVKGPAAYGRDTSLKIVRALTEHEYHLTPSLSGRKEYRFSPISWGLNMIRDYSCGTFMYC